MERFINWWFADYLTLYNTIHPPEKKVKKENKENKEKSNEEEKNNN